MRLLDVVMTYMPKLLRAVPDSDIEVSSGSKDSAATAMSETSAWLAILTCVMPL